MEELLEALREYAGVFVFAAALGLSLILFTGIGKLENTLYVQCLNSHNYYITEEEIGCRSHFLL